MKRGIAAEQYGPVDQREFEIAARFCSECAFLGELRVTRGIAMPEIEKERYETFGKKQGSVPSSSVR
jgi:hypothetical protein